MNDLSQFTQKYQLSKTLRLGLTLKEDSKKNPSHVQLKDLVLTSAKLIEKEVQSLIAFSETELVYKVSTCFAQMQDYMRQWQNIYTRYDQIALTKDFYKRMAKKANFDAMWEYKGKKQPPSQLISLSALKQGYEGKPRKDYLIEYWKENIQRSKQKFHEFELVINQFKEALNNQSMAHLKPHLVDFRKMFLTIINLIQETLIPLSNDSICFPSLVKLSSSQENKVIIEFASNEQREMRKELLAAIREIKTYFEDNGGYANYGRVTLNKYTAEQKPNRTALEDSIEVLKIDELIKELINRNDIEIQNYFNVVDDKRTLFSNVKLSIIRRVQCFKNKPIPVAVRFMLAEYLFKQHGFDHEKVLHIFEMIGRPISIGEEYNNCEDQSNFNLAHYPLKLAFDYAWESLAKSEYHKDVAFPEEHCKSFLSKFFDVDTTNNDFKLYASLLFLKENLATLDHEQNTPTDRQKFIDQAKGELNTPAVQAIVDSKDNRITKTQIKTIECWINKNEQDQKTEKANNSSSFKDYEKAKQQLGLLRGGLKNRISKYGKLTKDFKDLASSFGKDFGTLRDQLREENELNKISHRGIIIEDEHKDRYVLLSPVTGNENLDLDAFLDAENENALKTYTVKSLTSKSLKKFIANKGTYKDFHILNKNCITTSKNPEGKQTTIYHHEDIIHSLQHSTMAKDQHWAADFACDFDRCNTYEKIERELDSKAYLLSKKSISVEGLTNLIKNKECLLLPFVNQDITSKEGKLKNQFSKDWAMLFQRDNAYRLHPEFKIVYRHPTSDYPASKRYSRFQMIAQLLCEYIPQTADYTSKKQQLEMFNDKDKQQVAVTKFNNSIQLPEYHILGIDRGLKQLATLCIMNHKGQIQGGHAIYTRSFNADEGKKQWEHRLLETRDILDLSNLRVETTIDGQKVLVDLAHIKTKDKDGKVKDNQQKIKLKQLSYVRKVQYIMQNEEEKVLKFFASNHTPEAIQSNIKELIRPYKEGKHYEDLPCEQIQDMLAQFQTFCKEKDEASKKNLIELDAAENLKRGVVANMIGVVAYFLEKYEYKTYISLENLCRAFHPAKDGLSGASLEQSKHTNDVDFKDQENLVLAGLGTYHFFEMQLLKKIFKIQQEQEIYHLVPAFRSTDNYEHIVKTKKKYVDYPFGIVHFIDPMNTSKKCPVCDENVQVRQSHKSDTLFCKKCNYDSTSTKSSEFSTLIKDKKKSHIHIELIQNGDDNGAYHIAKKTLDNLNKLNK